MGYFLAFIFAAAFGIFVGKDANARGMNGILWGIFSFLFLLPTVPIYLIVRRPIESQAFVSGGSTASHANPIPQTSPGITELVAAIQSDNKVLAKRLLDTHQVVATAQNEYGRGLLQMAVYCKATECAALLIEYGADPMLVDSQGVSAVDMFNSKGGSPEMREVLFPTESQAEPSVGNQNTDRDAASQLIELVGLLDRGLLSKEEFNVLKGKLMTAETRSS